MLQFFRERAAVFVWVIVICFVITLVAGTFVSQFSGKGEGSRQQDGDVLASVLSYSVSNQKYQLALSQQLSSLFRDGKMSVSPDILEIYQYRIFKSVLFQEVLYEESLKRNMKVSSREMKAGFHEFYMSYDLKDKKALKKMLKEQQRTYRDFKESLKRSIVLRKMTMLIQNGVQLSDKHVEDSFEDLQMQYIYVQPDDVTFTKDQLFLVMNSVGGVNFDELLNMVEATNVVQNLISEPSWFYYGLLPKSVMDRVYLLDNGDVSDAIPYHNGYFVVKRVSSRYKEKPDDYEEVDYKKELLQALKSQEIQLFLSFLLVNQTFDFNDVTLRAIDAKISNNLDVAIASYRLMSSQQVSNPVPHYFLGKLYLSKGDYVQAKQEFQKAEVKVDLLKDFSFPELYFVMGQFFEIAKDTVASVSYYKKVLFLSEERMDLLAALKEKYTQLGLTTELAQVDTFIQAIKGVEDVKKETEVVNTN